MSPQDDIVHDFQLTLLIGEQMFSLEIVSKFCVVGVIKADESFLSVSCLTSVLKTELLLERPAFVGLSPCYLMLHSGKYIVKANGT